MKIWVVYFLRNKKEFFSAVVIAPSESRVRKMISEKDKLDLFETQQRDWLSSNVAVCKCIGKANSDRKPGIVFFQRPRFLSDRDVVFDETWAVLKRKRLVN